MDQRFEAALRDTEEAFGQLRALREAQRNGVREHAEVRAEAIRAEARRLREALAVVRVSTKPAELMWELRQWRLSHDFLRVVQHGILERYPDDFDWNAHLNALNETLDYNEGFAVWETAEIARA